MRFFSEAGGCNCNRNSTKHASEKQEDERGENENEHAEIEEYVSNRLKKKDKGEPRHRCKQKWNQRDHKACHDQYAQVSANRRMDAEERGCEC